MKTITLKRLKNRNGLSNELDIQSFKPKSCKFPSKISIIEEIAKKLKKPIFEIKKKFKKQIEIIYEKRINEFIIWKLLTDIGWHLSEYTFYNKIHPHISNPYRHDALPSSWDKQITWNEKTKTFNISLSHKLRIGYEIFKNKEWLNYIKSELNKKQPLYRKKMYQDDLIKMYDFLDIKKEQFTFEEAFKDIEKHKWVEKQLSKFLIKKTDENKLEIAEIEKAMVKFGKVKIKIVNNRGNEIKSVFVQYNLDKTIFKPSLIIDQEFEVVNSTIENGFKREIGYTSGKVSLRLSKI